MKWCQIVVACWCIASSLSAAAQAREWTDSTGLYTLEADLVAFDDKTVVFKRGDHELGALPIAKLSAKDQQYLKSDDAAKLNAQAAEGKQTWTLLDGEKISGRMVEFAHRPLTIQRRRGRVYVNDRQLRTLPALDQQLLPAIVNHFEKLPRVDRRALNDWVLAQRGQPRTFQVSGVVLEIENGEEVVVPLFLLADADLKLLRPGFDRWLAAKEAKEYESQEDLSFLLETLAAARERDQAIQREIALMQLQLLQVNAGLTSLWEVTLYPAFGQGWPLWVVVPGRNSAIATEEALLQNPGFVAGAVRRLSR